MLEGLKQNLGLTRDATDSELDLPLSVFPVEEWIIRGLPLGQGLWMQQTWV